MVITKSRRDSHRTELLTRIRKLLKIIRGRDLISSFEGLSRGNWNNPHSQCFINRFDLSLAVNDFDNILKEIKKLK